MQGRNRDLLKIYSSPKVKSKEDYTSATDNIFSKDQGTATGNAPPKNTTRNTPPKDATRNLPPKDTTRNIPPSKNATRNMPRNASSSINPARNISSSKKRKLRGDTKAGRKSKDNILLDLN